MYFQAYAVPESMREKFCMAVEHFYGRIVKLAESHPFFDFALAGSKHTKHKGVISQLFFCGISHIKHPTHVRAIAPVFCAEIKQEKPIFNFLISGIMRLGASFSGSNNRRK